MVFKMTAFIATLLLFCIVLPAGAQEAAKSDATSRYLPVSVEQVEPCCMQEETPEQPQPLSRKPVVKPEGNYFDEATMRWWKQQAITDLRAPKAEDFSTAKEIMAPLAPRLLAAFDGTNIVDAKEDGFLYTPPDTNLAVGPTQVIEATNSILRLSSRTNTAVSFQPLRQHFHSTEGYFDPKVYFDKLSQRFIIVALIYDDAPRKSAILVSISKKASPASLSVDWCNYRMNGVRNATWADFPGLGVNEKWMVVTTNQFTFDGDNFRSAVVRAIDKKAFNNTASCPALSMRTFELKDGSFTLQPAFHYTTNTISGSSLFLVSNEIGFGTEYRLWRISGATPALTNVTLTGTNYVIPPSAAQKGGGVPLDTGDNRVVHTVFRNGEVWTAHSTSCTIGSAPNESCVRLIRITPNDSGGTISFDKTYGLGKQFIWMPSIAVNKNNDVGITFQRSAGTIFLSVAMNGKRASATSTDAIAPLKAGLCHYEFIPPGASNRTGDYTGAQVDPLDDTSFWFAGEYAGKPPGETRCLWLTRISHTTY